ncbi:hypothetical protein [Ruminiclostridium cellobioparum]|jgi:hypothetical protein|uniref:hypothetical protein n=1 Tax=Ruminiclostridium cellobioparum TaxID=29355 RepID=UPI000B2B17AF|nr:hypothetical protein [Ruminiclostridium cellobioparum]
MKYILPLILQITIVIISVRLPKNLVYYNMLKVYNPDEKVNIAEEIIFLSKNSGSTRRKYDICA